MNTSFDTTDTSAPDTNRNDITVSASSTIALCNDSSNVIEDREQDDDEEEEVRRDVAAAVPVPDNQNNINNVNIDIDINNITDTNSDPNDVVLVGTNSTNNANSTNGNNHNMINNKTNNNIVDDEKNLVFVDKNNDDDDDDNEEDEEEEQHRMENINEYPHTFTATTAVAAVAASAPPSTPTQTTEIQPFTTTKANTSTNANLSKTTTTTTATSTTTAEERKEQLLLQAQYDRIQWIQQVPLPYHYSYSYSYSYSYGEIVAATPSSSTSTSTTTTTTTTRFPAHATFHLPTISKVIQYLYDNNNNNNHTNAIPDVDQQLEQLLLQKSAHQPPHHHQQQQQQKQHSTTFPMDDTKRNTCYPSELLFYRMTGIQLLQQEMELLQRHTSTASATSTSSNDTTTATRSSILSNITSNELLHDYHTFLQLLIYDPIYIPMLHKVRKFIRQLYNTPNLTSAINNDTTTTTAGTESIDDIVSKFLYYMMDTLFDQEFVSLYTTSNNENTITNDVSVSSSSIFRIDSNKTSSTKASDTTTTYATMTTIERLRRSYESFIYGHMYTYFIQLFTAKRNTNTNNTNVVVQQNIQFQNNVQFLSCFVTCYHLDIHCLISYLDREKQSQVINNSGNSNIKTDQPIDWEYNTVLPIFLKCILIFQSIDMYYSPYEKLQRILLLYREITVTLHAIMNTTTKTPGASINASSISSTTTTATKSPSADDILPTFIYIIVLAYKYKNDHSNNYTNHKNYDHQHKLPEQQQQSFTNLFFNLYYIEQLLTLSSPSPSSGSTGIGSSFTNRIGHKYNNTNHLRGEAGYAYTNLYSAYQFIHDFLPPTPPLPSQETTALKIYHGDLSTSTPKSLPKAPSSISISNIEWQNVLKKYQQDVQEKCTCYNEAFKRKQSLRIDTYKVDYDLAFEGRMRQDEAMHQHHDETIESMSTTSIETAAFPTPMDIRRARLRGEAIDMNWAMALQQEQLKQEDQHQEIEDGTAETGVSSPKTNTPRMNISHQRNPSASVFEQVEDILPHGFHRNYNFIHVQNMDELKYTDVQDLLKEYHLLVRTTETLLSERALQISKHRRTIQRKQQDEFMSMQQQQQQQQH